MFAFIKIYNYFYLSISKCITNFIFYKDNFSLFSFFLCFIKYSYLLIIIIGLYLFLICFFEFDILDICYRVIPFLLFYFSLLLYLLILNIFTNYQYNSYYFCPASFSNSALLFYILALLNYL